MHRLPTRFSTGSTRPIGTRRSRRAAYAMCVLIAAASFHVCSMRACAAESVAQSSRRVSWDDCLRQPRQWYASPEAIRIADNVLLYQRQCGGWPKNIDMAAMLTRPQQARIQADKQRKDATIDNGATCRQLRYLAHVYQATRHERFRAAFLRGIDYLLAAQYDTGGWPQFYPDPTGYHAHITFNDGAMINVMRLLDELSKGKAEFAFVDERRRKAAAGAVARGIDCILKCQIRRDGRLLGWCAQHDPVTFDPRPARSYEKVSLSGSEAVGIVAFLMDVQPPTPHIVKAIESAVRWFDEVKITGLRVVRKPAPGTPKGYDKIVVADPDAPPLWARFYEIGTHRPIFCSRDGIVRYRLSDISYERRNGYSWYTTAPAALLDRLYPKWAARWTPGRDVRTRTAGGADTVLR